MTPETVGNEEVPFAFKYVKMESTAELLEFKKAVMMGIIAYIEEDGLKHDYKESMQLINEVRRMGNELKNMQNENNSKQNNIGFSLCR